MGQVRIETFASSTFVSGPTTTTIYTVPTGKVAQVRVQYYQTKTTSTATSDNSYIEMGGYETHRIDGADSGATGTDGHTQVAFTADVDVAQTYYVKAAETVTVTQTDTNETNIRLLIIEETEAS